MGPTPKKQRSVRGGGDNRKHNDDAQSQRNGEKNRDESGDLNTNAASLINGSFIHHLLQRVPAFIMTAAL